MACLLVIQFSSYYSDISIVKEVFHVFNIYLISIILLILFNHLYFNFANIKEFSTLTVDYSSELHLNIGEVSTEIVRGSSNIDCVLSNQRNLLIIYHQLIYTSSPRIDVNNTMFLYPYPVATVLLHST